MKKETKLEQTILDISSLVEQEEKRLNTLKKDKREKKVMDKDAIAVKNGIIRGLKMALVLCNCHAGTIKPMK
jgi:hypothetical protein